MELPRVKIGYGNGAIGQTVSSADGLLLIAIAGAIAVETTFALAKHYPLQRLSSLEELGVTAENNPLVYKVVKDFYTEANEGTKVYIVGYPSTLTMSAILDKDNPYLRDVIELTRGEIRGIVITKSLEETPTIAGGLSDDVKAAMIAAQGLGEWSTETMQAPIFTLIDGVGYAGNAEDLEDLKTFTNNRVGIVIGDTVKGSVNQAVGLVAGRVANVPVHRNIGRVKDGALKVATMYAKDKAIELSDIATIHGKGYITFRTFTGLSGYYIADDLLATKEIDDYNQLTRRRTIDKARRIAYPTLVNELLDEIPVNADGTILETTAASIEQIVINAIANSMTVNGELSTDPSDANDQGVQCVVDRTIDMLATNRIDIELRVRPYAYAKYINVLLGFTINQN
ncbi:DUF2586 family protein [Dysgonomonas sp. ZJ279]|uniref:DUF2586 family protein n=1 Tax=Dysgonomonas sp. ZJ279 TaxID=2709796 RepID=UPI001C872393|nr:DUF2586 family protein [Dysgonomonas sp. ZJ279]